MEKDPVTQSMLSSRTTKEQAKRAEDIRKRKELKLEKEKRAEKFWASLWSKLGKTAAIALAVVAVVAALAFKNLSAIKALKEEKAEAQAQLDALNSRIETLEDELERVTSEEYIESQARSQLDMIKPGEVLYKTVEDEDE